MSYRNLPKSLWEKMDRCVARVRMNQGDEVNPYAVCYVALMRAREKLKNAKKKRSSNR